jgi:dihydroorotate dehydrogenase electron transfer subunit
VTTDDGSLGERGFVTGPLERHLQEAGGSDTVIYACGPWPMMRRVAELAAGAYVECYASLEAPMACGFGICVGCVVAVEGEGTTRTRGFASMGRFFRPQESGGRSTRCSMDRIAQDAPDGMDADERRG